MKFSRNELSLLENSSGKCPQRNADEAPHTFFRNFPRMWHRRLTPSKHIASNRPLPSILVTCAYSCSSSLKINSRFSDSFSFLPRRRFLPPFPLFFGILLFCYFVLGQSTKDFSLNFITVRIEFDSIAVHLDQHCIDFTPLRVTAPNEKMADTFWQVHYVLRIGVLMQIVWNIDSWHFIDSMGGSEGEVPLQMSSLSRVLLRWKADRLPKSNAVENLERSLNSQKLLIDARLKTLEYENRSLAPPKSVISTTQHWIEFAAPKTFSSKPKKEKAKWTKSRIKAKLLISFSFSTRQTIPEICRKGTGNKKKKLQFLIRQRTSEDWMQRISVKMWWCDVVCLCWNCAGNVCRLRNSRADE